MRLFRLALAVTLKLTAETLIIRVLLPHIDATYRTITSRSDRALEGFSIGGSGATCLTVKSPELLCSLHTQAGNVMHLLALSDPSQSKTYANE